MTRTIKWLRTERPGVDSWHDKESITILKPEWWGDDEDGDDLGDEDDDSKEEETRAH
jgi:hypothetical protein